MHSNSRIGKLLIAHPMFPPNNPFAKTVIYIYQDDSINGTVGLVLNRPSQTTVAQLAAQDGHQFFDTTKMVHMGGPVNKNALIMLHTDDWHSANTASAGDKLRISSDTHMLEKMADGTDQPAFWKVFIGSSTWMPGQLQSEIDRPIIGGTWLECKADESTIFMLNGENLWITALEMYGQQTIDHYF